MELDDLGVKFRYARLTPNLGLDVWVVGALPKTVNDLLHKAWPHIHREKRRWRDPIAEMIGARPQPEWLVAGERCNIHVRTALPRTRDPDSSAVVAKAMIDGVTLGGGLPDDSSKWVGSVTFHAVRKSKVPVVNLVVLREGVDITVAPVLDVLDYLQRP